VTNCCDKRPAFITSAINRWSVCCHDICVFTDRYLVVTIPHCFGCRGYSAYRTAESNLVVSVAWQWLFNAFDNSAFQTTCHNIYISNDSSCENNRYAKCLILTLLEYAEGSSENSTVFTISPLRDSCPEDTTMKTDMRVSSLSVSLFIIDALSAAKFKYCRTSNNRMINTDLGRTWKCAAKSIFKVLPGIRLRD
jgi:hypothetical protein